jgi:hypothetical protein
MELQTHGARKYPTSALLRSSAGLGCDVTAELRSHGASNLPVIVPQRVEFVAHVHRRPIAARGSAAAVAWVDRVQATPAQT